MIQKLTKVFACMLPVLFVVLSVTLLCSAQQMGTGDDKMASQQTVTGCLQKGSEPTGGYFIVAKGKHWELYPTGDVSLAEHVGHKVTVMGTMPKRTAEQEQTSQPYEKKETGTGMHQDLQVSSLKMISESCKK